VTVPARHPEILNFRTPSSDITSTSNALIRSPRMNLPGHSTLAILAALWIECSLTKFFPQYSLNKTGLKNLIAGFSTLIDFPSHINAEVTGSIHEGGEFRYTLAVAPGAVTDKLGLIVPVIISNGEAETRPTAASVNSLLQTDHELTKVYSAWHAAKYIDPKESGAILSIAHVNGFKISERTINGCMDNKEIIAFSLVTATRLGS